jgi:hypothetical protein
VSEEAERPELEAVRRLLAEARHDAPMPDDVAERMDRVLASLRDPEEGGGVGSAVEPAIAPVVVLAERRRRRAAPLLVAAAAIVVGGVTVAQHLPLESGGHPSAGSAVEDQRAGADSSTTGSRPHTSGKVSPGPYVQNSPPLKTLDGRVLVRPGHFSADALSARKVAGQAPSGGLDSVQLRRLPSGCVPALDNVEVVPATYQKAPAALVYHAPAGTTQVVDLYVCTSARPIRSVTLPTP